MATTRSARRLVPPERTPAAVGPGTYDPQLPSPREPEGVIVPFLSSDERKVLAVSRNAEASPGPGSYSAPSSFSAASPASAAFRTASKRFGPTAAASGALVEPSSLSTPGPGSYTVPGMADLAMHSSMRSPRSARAGGTAAAGGAAAAAAAAAAGLGVPRPTGSAPTIPGKHHLGYKRGATGALVPQAVATKGELDRGPGAYDARLASGRSSMPFSRSTTKRNPFPSAPGPGPGEYNPSKKPQKPLHRPPRRRLATADGGSGRQRRPMHGVSAAASGSKPLLSVAHTYSAKRLPPGPGSYSLPGSIRSHTFRRGRQNFGSSSDRAMILMRQGRTPYTDPDSLAVPGPGSYGEKRIAFDTISSGRPKPTLKEDKVPFSSTAERFGSMPAREPGPGAYDVKPRTATGASRRRGRQRGAFGSASDRFGAPAPPGRLPPSADPALVALLEEGSRRPPPRRPQRRKPLRKPGAFGAAAPRFARGGPTADEVAARMSVPVRRGSGSGPPPGAYDIRSSWVKRSGGKIISKAARFSPAASSDTPGPGSYADGITAAARGVEFGDVERSAGFRSGTSRFSSRKATHSVGPGQYNVRSSMVPRTYNVTMTRRRRKKKKPQLRSGHLRPTGAPTGAALVSAED